MESIIVKTNNKFTWKDVTAKVIPKQSLRDSITYAEIEPTKIKTNTTTPHNINYANRFWILDICMNLKTFINWISW